MDPKSALTIKPGTAHRLAVKSTSDTEMADMTMFVPFQGSSEKKVCFSFFYFFFCGAWVWLRPAYAKCSTSCPALGHPRAGIEYALRIRKAVANNRIS